MIDRKIVSGCPDSLHVRPCYVKMQWLVKNGVMIVSSAIIPRGVALAEHPQPHPRSD